MGLRATGNGVAIVACNSCRPASDGRDDGGPAGGARLVDALREVAASDQRYAGIGIEEMACLFACRDPCAVHLRGPDRISYVMGRFTPDAQAARAILDYARGYAASAWGEVPFADWPEGVKGHFITRTPPPGFVVD